MSKTHKAQRGDKVNDSRRLPKTANGTIIAMLYSDDGPDEVIVLYDQERELYDYSEFQYSWTDAYGGTFILS